MRNYFHVFFEVVNLILQQIFKETDFKCYSSEGQFAISFH